LLAVAGILSGEMPSAKEIEEELYGKTGYPANIDGK